MARRVCVVSSGRADYGLLYWPMRQIQQSADLELQTVATGMHLVQEHGMTVDSFGRDGFPVSKRLDILLSGDSSIAVTKSMGLAVIGFADVFEQLQPDIILLLGDRFEILAAAQAALVACIPVAHLFGGDTTEGAFDESIRHSITKMSHMHFVSNKQSARRVVQMGENPTHVHVVGSTGIDAICRTALLQADELFTVIDFAPRKRNVMITFHPVTLGLESSLREFDELLTALDMLGEDVGLIFTRPNADTKGQALNAMLQHYVDTHANAKAFDALGKYYLSALSHVDAVVGNSSSGLYEAPSFHVGTVNIGDRQKGRLQAASVINCEAKSEAIFEAIIRAFNEDYSSVINPYGDGHASEKIVSVLSSITDFSALLQKHFFMLEEE